MRIKTLVILSVLALLIGGAAGGGYAFISQEKTLPLPNNQIAEQKPLTDEEKDEVILDHFIAEQEEEHPDGLTESTIAVGSKYDGITYNNVTPATNSGNGSTTSEKKDTAATSTEKKENNKDNKTETPAKTESGLWDGAAGSQQVGVVDVNSSSSLNIRKNPSMDGQIIGKLYKDNEVLVVGKDGNWYQIVTGDGVEGYVSADYLKIVD